MPIQAPQWTEFLSCPICFNIFDEREHRPISLGCGHTVCKTCLSKLTPRKCPFDQNSIIRDIEELPVNYALLQLVGVAVPESEQSVPTQGLAENVEYYNSATRCIEELAMYLKPTNKESQNSGSSQSTLSRPMQRKLVTLLNCQLIEEEGRTRAVRAARSLGERTVTELILQHQNPQQLSANLWAGVRARGCQFLGPAMQEEVLKLILLALEDGSPLSRKVLVLFVVQRLESQYPQASKTAIGHVVQLLYRASCFKVTKREEESSLMQLKEEFCTYDALRREHDSQIVQIATEAGLRISPEQWSSLLYGDTAHKSHMQSIIDKLQTPQSFSQSINELTMALQRTGDPGNLSRLKVHLELLSNVDPGSDSPTPTWEILDKTMQAIKAIVEGLVDFCQNRTSKKQEFVPLHNPKYKTSMCRDLVQKGKCPRGTSCTFAHSAEELERYRQMSKKGTSVTSLTQPPMTAQIKVSTSSALTPQERESLKRVIKSSNAKINSSKAREPQMVTAELPSETKNTAASYQRKTEHSGKAVSVPIVKPCTLPTNTKAKMESSIYSLSLLSDKIEDDSLHPGIIPVAKKISSVQAHGGQGLQPSQMPGRPPPAQHAHAQQQQQYIYNPNQYHSSVTYQSPVYSPAAGQPRHVQTTRWQMATPEFQAISGDGRAEGNALQKVATVMPSYVRSDTDLYSVDCYGLNARDRAHYSSQAMRGRGKSPSEQLEELHTRKSELLAQLNKTRTMINQKEDLQDSDSRNDTAESADSTVSSSWEEESFSSLQSVLRMNEVSGAMLHHQHLSEQLSAGITTTTATTSSQYSLEGHRGQNHTSASTYCTMSLTQENLHSWGMEDTPKPDAEWSDGDEIIDLVMSSASMKDELVCSDEEAMTPWDPNWEDQIPLSTAVSDEMDEFVPFSEDYIVSKYGPISRMVKTKLRQQGPVCVTAGEMVFNHSGTVKSPFFCKSQDTQPVNAVTPMQRPYPITSQVPSRFLPQNPNVQRPTPSPSLQTAEPKKEQTGNGTKKTVSEETKTANKASQKELLRNPQAQKGGHHVHKADPNGMQVAASLPTALLQPNVLARANKDSEPHTLWMLRQRMSCQEQNRVPQVSSQPYVPENLKSEIANLNSKIENLQLSEDERLVKELQAIELSIAQAERNTEPVHPVPVYGDVQTGALSPHTLYTAFNHRQPLHVQGQYPEQPVAANMYVKSMEQQEPVPSGQLDRMRQYDSYIGSQGVDYLLAREAQKLEINRQHAKVIQESSDRLYAEDIAKREMEKFVRSKNE